MEEVESVDDSQEDFDEYYASLQQKHDAEMEYYTCLAGRETKRWIEASTGKQFSHPENMIRSLEDGVLLCELLNIFKPGCVKRVNKLATKMAKMDNIAVFLDACQRQFGLRVEQLFDVSDLLPDIPAEESQECSSSSSSSSSAKREEERRLRNVSVTVFWLARQLSSRGAKYAGPELDFAAFAPLVAAKSGAPQTADADEWSADLGGTVDDDSNMSERERASASPSLTNDRGHWRSSAVAVGDRCSSVDSLDDYAGSIRGSTNHRRMQSNDSLDSGCGGHGRKGSTTAAVGYDPLQFVSLKPAVDLARSAEETLRKAEAAKVLRKNIDRGEEEWQGNLSSWKQKRKSQSSSNLLSDDNEPERPIPQSGSSSNFHRYPYDDAPIDDLDDSAFHSVPSMDTTLADEASPARRTKSDSDFGSCSPKDDGNNDADSESEGGGSEDGRYGRQHDRSTVVFNRTSLTGASGKDIQSGGKLRLILKPPTTADDGFGFSIKGGIDKCAPITVESVAKGSSADEAGLAETDEVLEIGNEVVYNRTRGYCMLLINNALKKHARLELIIQRDTQKVAHAHADKKRGSAVTARSIFDMYESTEASAPREAPQADTYGSDVGQLGAEVTVVPIAATEAKALQQSAQDSDFATGRAASVGQNPAGAGHTVTPQEHETSDMQVAVEPAGVYTSFVQLRLSSGAETDSPSLDNTAEASANSTNLSWGQRRSASKDDDERKRMADWALEQERIQQRHYEAEQQALREQFDRDKAKAEETAVLRRQKEREAARERATKKLLELKRRFSSEASDVNGDIDLMSVTTGGHHAPRASSPTAGAQREPAAGLQSSSHGQGKSQRLLPDGGSIDSREQELRRKEEELKLMEERLIQEQQRILKEQQRLQQLREQQQQQLVARDEVLVKETTKSYSSQPGDRVQTAREERDSIFGVPSAATPSMSEVYKHYENTQLPEQLGSRDLTPPRLTRKEVMDMSKKATAAGQKEGGSAAVDGRQASGRHPQLRDGASAGPAQTVAARSTLAPGASKPVRPQSVSPGKTADRQPSSQQQNRNSWSQSGRAATVSYDTGPRKTAAATAPGRVDRSPKKDETDVPLAKMRSATLDRPSSLTKQKTVDFDPSMPSVVSKEDVLRLTREKPRYMCRGETRRDQSDDGGAVHPLRKCISGFDMRRHDAPDNFSGSKLTEAGSDEALNKSLDFRTSRALFEQQSRDADAYWKQRQAEDTQRRGLLGAAFRGQQKSQTLDRLTTKSGTSQKPNMTQTKPVARGSTGRSTSLPKNPAPAMTEWRKELEGVRQARKQWAAEDDNEDVGGAREKERRIREERNRELAMLRQINRGGESTPESEVAASASSDREDMVSPRGEAQMSFESDHSSSRNSLQEYLQPSYQYAHQRQSSSGTNGDELQAPQLAPIQSRQPPVGSEKPSNGKTRSSDSERTAQRPSDRGQNHLRQGDRPELNGKVASPNVADMMPPDSDLIDDEGQLGDDVISVSAKQLCTYCSHELGKGAAMVIESLNLCYHVDCFRCWSCRQLLSDGARGADVRVRDNRLHCRECYTNNMSIGTDEAFL